MIRAYMVLVSIGAAWAFTIPLTRVIAQTGAEPLGLIFWQLLIMVVVLSGILAVQKRPFPPLGRHFSLLLGIALLGTVIPNTFSYLAARHLPAGIMAIVISMVPLFGLPIALALGFERVEVRRFAGVALGAVAMVLIAGPEASLPEGTKAIWVLIALLAPLCYGCEGNFLTWRGSDGLHPLQMLWGASVVGLVLALVLSVATGTWFALSLQPGVLEGALITNTVLHVVAYTGYLWLVTQAGPVFSSQVAYVVTSFGVVFSMLLLGERYALWIWAALALSLIAIALVQPRDPGSAKGSAAPANSGSSQKG
ncbi:MAG: DMT family transporter [Pseudomonadota bacterium]